MKISRDILLVVPAILGIIFIIYSVSISSYELTMTSIVITSVSFGFTMYLLTEVPKDKESNETNKKLDESKDQ